MKKKHLCLVLTLIFALLLGGCASGETADKYVGRSDHFYQKSGSVFFIFFSGTGNFR